MTAHIRSPLAPVFSTTKTETPLTESFSDVVRASTSASLSDSGESEDGPLET